MANSKRTSYFYSIFGITLVLFVLGVAAVLGIEAKKVSKDFKENLTVELVLNDNIKPSEIISLKTKLQGKRYVKNTLFVSKEEAAKILQKDLGENFLDILGYNPLYASFNLNLLEDYANKDSFEMIKKDLTKFEEVKLVNIQGNLLEALDKNVRSATFVVLIVAIAFLIFSVSLIFNTIRLVMFSNRFIIKTQQLFGATRWFIIKPFLGRSLLNGFISGLSATSLVAALLYYFNYALPELGLLSDLVTFAALFTGLLVFGILISFLSTLTAVLRYLRLKVEDLY
ncbi:MAG: permease-like cell division protein FtsX [Bacteroidetes bacterium]|nr:permease-like cell division protein FtsX [Bacteroidota bacterium]